MSEIKATVVDFIKVLRNADIKVSPAETLDAMDTMHLVGLKNRTFLRTSLAMALSWSKASATMFTSYMAISNLSVVIGNKLIGPLSDIMSIGQIYVLMMFVCLSPVVFLKSMDPRPILHIKSEHQ